MTAEIFGPDLVIVAIVAVVVLFAGNRLPRLARNLGEAEREFRKSQHEAETEPARNPGTPPTGPPTQPDESV